VRERIEKSLDRFGRYDLRREFEQELLLDEFEQVLFKINYHDMDLVDQAVKIAKRIKTLHDWPENQELFWNWEAVGWKARVPVHVKDFIAEELSYLMKGKNLEIGCGSVCYIPGSVCIDVSHDMLMYNESGARAQARAELLCCKSDVFDSVTLVFVANYLPDLVKVAYELRRVLKREGKVVCVLSAKPIHRLHRLVETKSFSVDKLVYALNRVGLKTKKEKKVVGNTELFFVEGVK